MFGWLRRAERRASRMRSDWVLPPRRRTFTATFRSSEIWWASYTEPMPPRPIFWMMRQPPRQSPMASSRVRGAVSMVDLSGGGDLPTSGEIYHPPRWRPRAPERGSVRADGWAEGFPEPALAKGLGSPLRPAHFQRTVTLLAPAASRQ